MSAGGVWQTREDVRDGGPGHLAWSDDPDRRWNDAAAVMLRARVFPLRDKATEIVLEGRCPRCLHQTVSTHPIRAVMSDDQARFFAKKDGVVPRDGYAIRRVTTECRCSHEHPDTPEGRSGCGVPFALWVSWSTQPRTRSPFKRRLRQLLGRPQRRTRKVDSLKPAAQPSPLDLEEERELGAATVTQLADVRKAAESWRTGLAGFLAILVAVFFIKGKDSFDDISGTGWRTALAVLLLVSAAFALYGAYRALRAAYGTPRDEHLGEIPLLFRHLHPTTARYIYDYGTVSAWHYAAARVAVNDLRQAKVATIGSLLAFTAAASITWFAPGPSSPGFAEVTYQTKRTTAAICGKSVERRKGTLVIQPSRGKPQKIQPRKIVSIMIVKTCP
jgi:hypothetical protein